MKKMRFILLTIILMLSFGCSVFADDTTTSDTKKLYNVTASNGSHTFEVPAKAVSCGYFRAPNPETKEGGEVKAYYVIPKLLYPAGNTLSFGGNDAKLIANYGWTQEEIDFAKANFCAGFSNWGINYNDTTYAYNLNVDVSYTPDPEALKYQNGKDAWCEMYTVLKDYMTSLENWTEDGYQFPEPIEPTEPDEKLPNFTYKVSKKWHPHWTTNILQYNFYANWDSTEHEIYKSAPNNYYVECKAKLYMSGLSSSNSILIDKQPIVKNEISFSIDETMDKLLDSPLPDAPVQPDVYYPYYVMFRVISADGSKCSDWHFYLIEPQSGNKITDSGSFSENDSGDYELTDEPTDEDSEKIDNSNFTKDPNGGNTSASQNPDSAIYNDSSASVNASSLVTNLKSSVESIKDIASMISVCYQWLPSWLLSLIACSIGIIVVVGLVNIFRG